MHFVSVSCIFRSPFQMPMGSHASARVTDRPAALFLVSTAATRRRRCWGPRVAFVARIHFAAATAAASCWLLKPRPRSSEFYVLPLHNFSHGLTSPLLSRRKKERKLCKQVAPKQVPKTCGPSRRLESASHPIGD